MDVDNSSPGDKLAVMAQLLIAGFAGTAVTLAILLPYGVLVALLAAPFGGGIAILLVGCWLSWRLTRAGAARSAND